MLRLAEVNQILIGGAYWAKSAGLGSYFLDSLPPSREVLDSICIDLSSVWGKIMSKFALGGSH